MKREIIGLNSKHKYVMSVEKKKENEDLFSVIMNLGEGNGNPLQNSGWDNPMDRGACWGHQESDTIEHSCLQKCKFHVDWLFRPGFLTHTVHG